MSLADKPECLVLRKTVTTFAIITMSMVYSSIAYADRFGMYEDYDGGDSSPLSMVFLVLAYFGVSFWFILADKSPCRKWTRDHMGASLALFYGVPIALILVF